MGRAEIKSRCLRVAGINVVVEDVHRSAGRLRVAGGSGPALVYLGAEGETSAESRNVELHVCADCGCVFAKAAT